MNAPAGHNALQAQPAVCETCEQPFTPARRWSRFCTNRCRMAFHGAEARREAITAAALELYRALERIASFREGSVVTGSFDEPGSAQIARDAIKDLKPPAEPKALLEKAKGG